MNFPQYDSLVQYGLGGIVVQWAFLSLAAYRLTRVLIEDEWPPADWFRQYVARRTGRDSAWTTLITCGWCAATYTSAALYVLSDQMLPIPLPVLSYAATLTVVGYLATYDN